ncbi:adenosylcobinamide-phosphate synthase CbiB [Benzoatithermus flavus]|uniref:Cobalamin biosynthesis protein CobD n=1 Tax=Benzoatithermus flavus TaxID=3108223 RepID=A0ABU8XQR7_9PROT
MLLEFPLWLLPTLLIALACDALFGEPGWLYRRVPHPVVLIGRSIGWLEARLLVPVAAEGRKRIMGIILLIIVTMGAAGLGFILHLGLRIMPGGWLLEGLLASTLLAQRSLVEHVAAVATGLEQSLAEGRKAVSMIVGRDPERLDAAGVGRAAVESLAENLSDGVVAPLFWMVVAGLPGLLAYKAVNTLDSMIGHKSERYRAFGWASARLDDLMNLIPARLTGLLLCCAGTFWRQARFSSSIRIMLRDAPEHRSPNAGWPEAAMAAALGLRLAGPRVYGGVVVADGWMGHGRSEVDATDIRRAVALAWAAWWLAVIALLLALLLSVSI